MRKFIYIVLLLCACLLVNCENGQRLRARNISMAGDSYDDYIYHGYVEDSSTYEREHHVEVHLRASGETLHVEVCGTFRVILVKRKHVTCMAKDNRLIVTTRDVHNYWSNRVNGVETIKLSFDISPIVQTKWVWEFDEYEAANVDLSKEGLAFASDRYRVYVLKD